MKTELETFNINASTRMDRHLAIERVKEAIQASDGGIEDFTMFSNLSLCLTLSLPKRNLVTLYENLIKMEIRLTGGSEAQYDSLLQGKTKEDGTEARGTLQITFIHNEPDLRIEVPPIPG